tara:strand:+ start:3447 stop:4391 length:945 start_codon:yes stop_codon:yes gene_type:complete
MKNLFALALIFLAMEVYPQARDIAEKLGYPPGSKLLIIHADDVGLSHSENQASFNAIEHGSVSSASILVPCPWFLEVAEYAKKKGDAVDFGIHLTVTSEWQFYKWRPIAAVEKVPSLIADDGFLPALLAPVMKHANPDEVELEMRSQIETAKAHGIDITHLDAHMYGVKSTPQLLARYIKVGREYNLPILLDKNEPNMQELMKTMTFTDVDVIVDKTLMAAPENYDEKHGLKEYYTSILNTIEPGLNCLLIHPAYDDAEMQAITMDHPEYGAAWRQSDHDFFSSESCRELLEKNDIKVVTWREIRDKIVRVDKH